MLASRKAVDHVLPFIRQQSAFVDVSLINCLQVKYSFVVGILKIKICEEEEDPRIRHCHRLKIWWNLRHLGQSLVLSDMWEKL